MNSTVAHRYDRSNNVNSYLRYHDGSKPNIEPNNISFVLGRPSVSKNINTYSRNNKYPLANLIISNCDL